MKTPFKRSVHTVVKKPSAPAPTVRPVENPTSNLPARVTLTNPYLEGIDDTFLSNVCEDDGIGVSSDPDDNLLQFVKTLQPGSPEVLDGDGHIAGAKAGLFLCRGMDPELRSSIWFQPCGLRKCWMEFIHRDQGGGFVARHDCNQDGPSDLPNGAEPVPGKPNNFYFPATGNTCVLYRVVPGIIWDNGVPYEYVLNFYSTGHTVHRQWNGRMKKKINPQTKRPFASFAFIYELTTAFKKNKKGSWFLIEVSNGTPVWSPASIEIVGDPRDAYELGRQLGRAFDSGEKQARVEEPDVAAEPRDNDYREEADSSDDVPF